MPIVKTDITKKDILAEVTKQAKVLPKEQVAFLFNTILDVVVENLKDGKSVYLQGLGKFDFKDVPPRKSNLTGDIVPAHKRIKFYPNYYLSKNIRVESREV
jgi:nucleoid DNA-binding protein